MIDQERMRALRKRAGRGDYDAYDEYCELIEAERRRKRDKANRDIRVASLTGDRRLMESARKSLKDNS